MPRLENWLIIGDRIEGDIFGHHRLDDGERILTAPLKRVDFEFKMATSITSTYELGVYAEVVRGDASNIQPSTPDEGAIN